MIQLLLLSLVLLFKSYVESYLWTEEQIVSYMSSRPRGYFPHLFSKAGFKTGMEVGKSCIQS